MAQKSQFKERLILWRPIAGSTIIFGLFILIILMFKGLSSITISVLAILGLLFITQLTIGKVLIIELYEKHLHLGFLFQKKEIVPISDVEFAEVLALDSGPVTRHILQDETPYVPGGRVFWISGELMRLRLNRSRILRRTLGKPLIRILRKPLKVKQLIFPTKRAIDLLISLEELGINTQMRHATPQNDTPQNT